LEKRWDASAVLQFAAFSIVVTLFDAWEMRFCCRECDYASVVMPTILCIDDDPAILELQKSLLARSGYSVLTAPDAFTGVALTRQHAIDAVLLDMNMPGMDGHQVAQLLMQEQPGLPLVVWSGAMESIPEALLWFADAVVSKGNPYQQLLNALQVVLATSRRPPVSLTELPSNTRKAG